MKTYKMTISYDGTDYNGWQVQPHGKSIQETIENALNVILQNPVRIIGSGRTDAGVHALGQVAHFCLEDALDIWKVQYSLNGILPPDIRIISLEEAPEGFHAQYSAKEKTYHYHLWLDKVVDPFHYRYRHHVRSPSFDVVRLEAAAALCVGTHDFTSFATDATRGSASKNPVRTIYRAAVVEERGGFRVEFTGDGFLYKMVRNIMGTLLEISTGKRPVDDMSMLFETRDRRLAGHAAPARGLFLVNVSYPSHEQLRGH